MGKKKLLPLALLALGSGAAWAGPFDAWQYAAEVTVDNSDAVDLLEHQVQITFDSAALVGAGKMNADGSDLRFGSDDFSAVLPHWVESGMNTASTVVWVRVPAVPASSSAAVQMVYGNAGAADASDPGATFDLYEDFSVDMGEFSNECGNPAAAVAGGTASVSWSSNGIYSAATVFPVSEVFTVEADVEGISGTWPGIYWGRVGSGGDYAIMQNASQTRISVKGGGTTPCSGHNWASSLVDHSGAVGLWSFTWVDTGDQRSETPAPVGVLNASDSTYPRDADLRLYIGGISSGNGSMDLDWIRVRKFEETVPGVTIGAEGAPPEPAAPPGPVVDGEPPEPIPAVPFGALFVLAGMITTIGRRRLS